MRLLQELVLAVSRLLSITLTGFAAISPARLKIQSSMSSDFSTDCQHTKGFHGCQSQQHPPWTTRSDCESCAFSSSDSTSSFSTRVL